MIGGLIDWWINGIDVIGGSFMVAPKTTTLCSSVIPGTIFFFTDDAHQ